MKITPPGGELTFWSVVWILFALAAVYLAIATGNSGYYIVGACIGLPAIGMWLGLRWCGYLLSAFLALSIPLALLALVVVDDTLGERAYRLVRIAAAGYFAWISFVWARSG
jgi:hypothetical protein